MKNKINALLNKAHKKYIAYIRASFVGIICGFYLFFVVIAPSQSSAIKTDEASNLTSGITEPTITNTPKIPDNPLDYIRWKGQKEGYDDYTISGFIRLARVESGFKLDQYAKNPKSTAKGIYQFIDSTWRHYCLEDGNVYDWKDNIDCFYKVLKVDGYPKGLNHWATSLKKAGI